MRWPALLIASLTIVSCEQADSSSLSAAGSSQRAVYNGNGGNISSNANGFLTQAPEFFYPENSNIYLEREVQVPSNILPGEFHIFHEVLRANGQGEFNLKIAEAMKAGDTIFTPPTTEQQITYQDQQRYMVQYRDIHLGLQHGLSANFRWIEDPALQQVAGVDCLHYTVESVHNLGDAEFWVDANSGLLLAYTMYDNAGDITLKLETMLVDTAPDNSNIQWSAALVDEEVYDPNSNTITLDYDVLAPNYLPPGFYQRNARVLDSFGMFQGMGNMHVAMFTDGIHQLFVAQHSFVEAGPNAGQVPTAVTLARFSESGGIQMVEGDPPFKKVYVVGQMPRDEIQTVFSSLFN
jgi:hypothetical protein